MIFEVLEWDVKCGDKSEPVYYDNTIDVERNGAVQKVLRKWWFGECAYPFLGWWLKAD